MMKGPFERIAKEVLNQAQHKVSWPVTYLSSAHAIKIIKCVSQ
jgi:hypothetical protein